MSELEVDCVFCQIVNGDLPSKNVWDGIDSIGIVPLQTVTDGHVIFLPRKHISDSVDDPSVAGLVMHDASMFVKNAQMNSLYEGLYDSVNFISSVGRPATQSVFHHHVHVVPRKVDDGLALPWYSGKGNHKKH